MGAVIPIVMIALAATAATTAVIVAVSTVATLAIVLAAVSVAATAASVYFYVQGDVKNSMLFAGIGIAAGVGGLYISAQDAMASVVSQMEAGTISNVAVVDGAYASATLKVYTYVESMYASFSSFLQAIHFKTIMSIHQIAYLVSADYRASMDKVFQQIREVSYALGYGADYLNLILADTRNIVLSISASIGRSYDLSEVTWVSTYGEFLKHMSKSMARYQDHPNEFLWDLNQLVVKPGIDTQSTAMQAIILGTEKALEVSKTLAEDTVRIRNDIMKFVAHQPEVIRSQVMPELKKIVDEFDKFIRLSYDPAIKFLEGAYTALGGELTKQKTHIGDIIAKIRKPGSLLRMAEMLPDDERLEEERAIYDMSFKLANEEMQEVWEVEKPLIEETIEQARQETKLPIMPALGYVRIRIPVIGEKEVKTAIKTPFVGDF